VKVAPIHADGGLGDWVPTTSFGTARYNHTAVAQDGHLYIIGGRDNASFFRDVQVAPLNGDGTVGAWVPTSSFTTERGMHTSTAYNGNIYIIGGMAGGTTVLGDVQTARANPDGTLGPWMQGTALPAGRYSHASAAYGGQLYVVAGYTPLPGGNGTVLRDAWMAPLTADGALGQWTPANGLATARYSHSAVAASGNLIVTGGLAAGPTRFGDVQVAPLEQNGAVSSWNTTTPFPVPRRSHGSIAAGGFFYVIGGLNGAYLADVSSAPVNPDGSIGAWSSATALPATRGNFGTALGQGRVYVVGGGNNASVFDDIVVGSLGANGAISAWTPTLRLPSPRTGPAAVTAGGRLYVIGGYGSGALGEVISGTIAADGSISAWTQQPTLLTPRGHHAAVVYGSYVYVLGGTNGAASGCEQNSVFQPSRFTDCETS
jgi:N-acetylneuraminic acid mutarotase